MSASVLSLNGFPAVYACKPNNKQLIGQSHDFCSGYRLFVAPVASLEQGANDAPRYTKKLSLTKIVPILNLFFPYFTSCFIPI